MSRTHTGNVVTWEGLKVRVGTREVEVNATGEVDSRWDAVDHRARMTQEGPVGRDVMGWVHDLEWLTEVTIFNPMTGTEMWVDPRRYRKLFAVVFGACEEDLIDGD